MDIKIFETFLQSDPERMIGRIVGLIGGWRFSDVFLVVGLSDVLFIVGLLGFCLTGVMDESVVV